MSDALKPCPFCGSEKFHTTRDSVMCVGCHRDDMCEAVNYIKGWNRRAMPECVRELMEYTEGVRTGASSEFIHPVDHAELSERMKDVRAYYGEG